MKNVLMLKAVEKDFSCDLPARAAVVLTCPAGTEAEFSLSDKEGEVTKLGTVSTKRMETERYNIGGYTGLHIKQKSPNPIVVSIQDIEIEEPHDDLPPPAPAEPDNVLARLRETVRREMGVQREAFLEADPGFTGYEIDDDDPGEFEEEILDDLERKAAEQARADAEAKAKSEEERQQKHQQEQQQESESESESKE